MAKHFSCFRKLKKIKKLILFYILFHLLFLLLLNLIFCLLASRYLFGVFVCGLEMRNEPAGRKRVGFPFKGCTRI